ncbi:Histone deacetylase complex protein [Mycena sanguinolenta]|uniref:histone deacetylase n=1 Tax=Mycena sanguinolenta TaxID=230812 RepID=A0A8H6ZEX4_9AGAR|nr:Histone deacetylase complex protein [Mycena sanguinolenta]
MGEHHEDIMNVDSDPHHATSSLIPDSQLPSELTNHAPPKAASPVPRASSEPLRPSDATIGLVYDTKMTLHCSMSPDGHPEAPERIVRIWKALVAKHYTAKAKIIPTRQVLKQEALLVHSEDLWDKVEAIQHMTQQEFVDSERYYEQLSLYISQATTLSARLSWGELKKTFAVVRPPGHHAEPEEHMGFCFFNNVAVAARVVQQLTPIKKILILDWDVHHGNGTQRAFNDDSSVLYISLHRYERGEFYPCGPFGGLQSCGEGAGLGYSVNIPWPEKGMGDADYIHAFQKIVMPIAMEFAPELVIISAGFDAAEGDDLGECLVTPAGYSHMTYMLGGLAGGRLVVALEGGYNLDSITKSALAVTEIILGEAPPEMRPMVASEAAAETVWLVAREQSKYWKSVSPKACEPQEETSFTFSVPEILKLHRQYYLYSKHDMMQVPLVGAELEHRFSAQVMCTPDIFQKDTLVFMIHEFGNLRAELAFSANCDVQLERSYLIDFSKELVNWVKAEGYSLLDVNLFPKPSDQPFPRPKSITELRKDMVTYLWDNYVQLCNATNIILVGHGPGCQYLMDLVDLRSTSVMKCVKAIVQVVGPWPLRPPKNALDLRDWYKTVSFVALPANHPLVGPDAKSRDLKRHGTVQKVDEEQSVKLIIKALPAVKGFVKDKLTGVGSAQTAMSNMHFT